MMSNESKTKVLVVEDQKELADVYSEWLCDEYEVTTAYGGEDALEKFDDTVDIVLLDRRMPGLSGDEVLEQIRANDNDCQVAMVTAINPELDIIDMQFDEYVVKPVDKDELLDTVDGMLALRTYNDRVREYYSLSVKHTALMNNKPEGELSEDEEFRELEKRLAEVQDEFEQLQKELDYEQLKKAFKQINSNPRSSGHTTADEA